MIDENFYITLKLFFKRKNITQQQIAENIGTSQAYVNQLLTGKAAFGKSTAAKFEALYGLSSAWLITGVGDMMAQPQSGGTSINITRGGDVSVSGHHNVSTSGNASGSDDIVRSLLEQNAKLIAQTEKQMEMIQQLISRENDRH